MKIRPSYEAVRKAIPPLSQSRHGDMACETLYAHKHVQRARMGESEPAARGTEIHQVLATYINHLVRTRRASDLEAFDPEKILATELHIALDENFLPIEHPDATALGPLEFQPQLKSDHAWRAITA
jgi:hypothetical protein